MVAMVACIYPISHFATIHFPDRQTQTHTQTDGLGDRSVHERSARYADRERRANKATVENRLHPGAQPMTCTCGSLLLSKIWLESIG